MNLSVQDLRLKAHLQTILGCDCVSFNPSWQIPSAVLAGQTMQAEQGAKAGGVPCTREDLLACTVCTPSLPQLCKAQGTHSDLAFLPSYMTSRTQRDSMGIQEGRRALLMTTNKQTIKQTKSPTPATPLTGAPHPTHPRGLSQGHPSSCCRCWSFVGVFFFLLTSGFTCFCTPMDLKQCDLHYPFVHFP